MTRSQIIAFALSRGWKSWGQDRKRPHNGSVYRCFRRGNVYAWIGHRYAEHSLYGIAADFVAHGRTARRLLQ